MGSSNKAELNGVLPRDLRWKMSSFQHKTGLRQLIRIRQNAAHRYNLARFYVGSLRRYGWPSLTDVPFNGIRLLRLPIAVTEKNALLDAARAAGIEIGSWFETPLHPLPLTEHQKMGYDLGSCPVAEFAAAHVINLPLHDRVTHDDAETIVQFVVEHSTPAMIPTQLRG